MNSENENELILTALQYYLDSAQEFLSYDEMMDLKQRLETDCKRLGIAPNV